MPKTILVTGAGHGFGKGTVFGLAREGHRVIAAAEIWQQVWDLRREAEKEGLPLEVIKLDVLDEYERHYALDHDIDVLVNNGAIERAGPISEIPLDYVRESFDINVFAHLELTQGVIPRMIGKGAGKIVWLSSAGGVVSAGFDATYCATKFAIEAIAWGMKEELAPHGIAVATINPGSFRTGFNDTGTESAYYWHDPDKALVKMPDMTEVLADQSDPQEMIDEMVRVIPLDAHPYRTVKPDTAVDMMKQFQAQQWEAQVGPGT